MENSNDDLPISKVQSELPDEINARLDAERKRLKDEGLPIDPPRMSMEEVRYWQQVIKPEVERHNRQKELEKKEQE